ncbi:hypothetical protein C9374_003649 [Naegleria lovaniensis]|uniref:Uncharacterized protein n=1 Tax=Naegleria lovaniensis TaxID=51637 RepID=A0AA88H3D0_NAELO|nr:uncharacterized protein C9374_003649 [Naegleria lovaniensis]KAG2393885.1 hypothetical protein C9374_003649 [Naegleria lovaniensis]
MSTEDHNSTSIMLDEGSAILDSGGVFHDAHSLTHSSATTPEASSNSTSTTESARRKRATSSASSSSTRRTSKAKKKKSQEQDDESSPEEDAASSNENQDSLSHHRVLLPNQRTACPMEEVPDNQQGRYWIFETPQNAEPLNDVVVRVTMKIRGEEARNYVPEKLYSSHKYVIMHEISGKSLVEKYPLIVSKIHVINPTTREELKNSKNSSKLCLMGTMETALTKLAGTNGKKTKDTSSEDVVKGQMKVQFTDVSYHHEKGHFGFIIHYFNPANLETPLFSLIAPPFNVFARKPTNENQTETLQPTKPKPSKRKRKSDVENEADNVSSSALEATSSTAATTAEASNHAGADATTHAATSPSKKKTRRPKKQTQKTSEEAAQQQVLPTYTVTVTSTQPSQHMIEFNKKLEALVNIKKQLGQDASKRASELALQNLINLDTFATQEFVLQNSNSTITPQTTTNDGQQILQSSDGPINPTATNNSGL